MMLEFFCFFVRPFSEERWKKGSLSLTTLLIECKERKTTRREEANILELILIMLQKIEEEGQTVRRLYGWTVGQTGGMLHVLWIFWRQEEKGG